MDTGKSVGTLRERPLHADLKRWYAQDGDLFEQPLDGFVIDIVRPDLLIEIQTRSFTSMKRKLTSLLQHHRVRVVHPIAVDQWIVKVNQETGEITRRMSPKHGQPADVFAELVAFPEFVDHPHFSVELLMVRAEQQRRFAEGKAWRRKGWVIEEHRLIDVVDRVLIEDSDDLSALLPASVPTLFTTADLAVALGRGRRLAQQMAYCLRHLEQLEVVGKRGRSLEYRRAAGMEATA